MHAARADLHYLHLIGVVLARVGGGRGASSGGKVLRRFERAVAHLHMGPKGCVCEVEMRQQSFAKTGPRRR